MKGHKAGVQIHILKLNSRAFFVPCYVHRLNLVVCDGVKMSTAGILYFSTVQAIYNFLSGSIQRWAVLKKHLEKDLTVKPLSERRWESRIDTIKPLHHDPGKIYDALYEISEDESFDAHVRCEAESLTRKVQTFSFCSTVLLHKILHQIDLVLSLIHISEPTRPY